MSRLLDELQGTSLADVQRGGPGNPASKDAGTHPPPEVPPDEPPGSAVATATGRTTPGTGDGSMHAGGDASKPPRTPRRIRGSTQAGMPAGTPARTPASGDADGDAGLAASLQPQEKKVYTKRTFDVDAAVLARLDAACDHHGRGSQRKIVDFALDEALRSIGF